MKKKSILLIVALSTLLIALLVLYVSAARKQNVDIVDFTGTYSNKAEIPQLKFLSVAGNGTYVLYLLNDPVESGTYSVQKGVLLLEAEAGGSCSYLISSGKQYLLLQGTTVETFTKTSEAPTYYTAG